MEIEILKIYYKDDFGNPRMYIVGESCLEIVEHSVQGEGDKWFYDVKFARGKGIKLFSFDSVEYKEVKGDSF